MGKNISNKFQTLRGAQMQARGCGHGDGPLLYLEHCLQCHLLQARDGRTARWDGGPWCQQGNQDRQAGGQHPFAVVLGCDLQQCLQGADAGLQVGKLLRACGWLPRGEGQAVQGQDGPGVDIRADGRRIAPQEHG